MSSGRLLPTATSRALCHLRDGDFERWAGDGPTDNSGSGQLVGCRVLSIVLAAPIRRSAHSDKGCPPGYRLLDGERGAITSRFRSVTPNVLDGDTPQNCRSARVSARYAPASRPNTRAKILSTLRSWRSTENASAIFSCESTARTSGSASIVARKSPSSSHAFIAFDCTSA